ncbi:hypothetical protein INS49_003935 [Diaporthe citri]|uniref:uncharacterized protein n=1 Tax=Diaporthe citri TaxID=83186 RepID=UPI001C80A177|nr:uncharacterized protein INS49_003935 [Diaporthe citri]KAG6354854.1 hypothetical protein INS49_003935 [Diaporthe citri]
MQTPDPSDRLLEGVHQSLDRLTVPLYGQTSSFTILPSLLSGQDEIITFSASFPDHLLSNQVEDKTHTNNNTVPALELQSFYTLTARPLSHSSQLPFQEILAKNFTSAEAHDLVPSNTVTCGKANGGRTSPQPSTITGESSSLSDSPSSSRRSSWATSISTRLGDNDVDHSDFDYAKHAAEPDQNTEEIELIDEYQHYCQLIELGDPRNRRGRDSMAQKPVEEGCNEVNAPRTATPDAGDLDVALAVEASGKAGSDDSNAPPMQAGLDAREERMQQESMQPETQSALDSENNSTPPSTPAEAAAWAHSYCDADPESTKLKILTDDRGREYVLYHDCFHCVPIDLAPEFIGMIQEEDDGYGSATETCEASRDGAKLGTIPEEEDEG